MFLRIFLFFSLVSFTIEAQELDSLQKVIQKSLDTASTKKSKFEILLSSGDYFYGRDLHKAEYFFSQAYNLLDADEFENKGYIDEKLGILYRRLGEFDKSYEHSTKAEQSFRTLNDTTKLAGVILDKGFLFRYLKDTEKEIQNYRQGLHLLNGKNNRLYAKGLNLVGGYFLRTNKLDSSLFYYQKSLNLFKKLKSDKFINEVNNNIAVVYSKQKKYKKAIETRLHIIEYAKRNNNKMSQSLIYYNLASSFSKLKQNDIALKYIDSSISIAKEKDYKLRISKGYRAKGLIHAAMNDYKNAYNSTKLYKTYSDSIFNIEKQKKIKEIELKNEFELEKKELEMEANKKEIQNKSYIIILITVMILGSILVFSGFKNYRARTKIAKEQFEKEKLKKEVLFQKVKTSENELKSLIADNTMRLEFIKQLSKQIKFDKDKSESLEVKNYTNGLLLKLQQQISTENKFSVLKDKIDEINRGFDEKIITQYPNLTKTEREVCSLLRLNLSIKEIASIRNATSDSVKAVRYRIRKKMEVPKHQELEYFIQNLSF